MVWVVFASYGLIVDRIFQCISVAECGLRLEEEARNIQAPWVFKQTAGKIIAVNIIIIWNKRTAASLEGNKAFIIAGVHWGGSEILGG